MSCEQILEIVQGDDVSWPLIFTENGESFDISEGTIWFTAKTDPTTADPGQLQQWHTLLSTEGTDGIYNFAISNTKTVLIVAGTYYFDFQYKSKAGKITTVGLGRVIVKQQVTKATTPAQVKT